MSAITMNTLTGAVAEYDGFPFQCITPTHAGNAVGLFTFGGDTDEGAAIVARVQTGKTAWGEGAKMLMNTVYFGMKGSGSYTLHVAGETLEYAYAFTASTTGESRAVPGRGIRESYLSFGFSNPDGQDFKIDALEVTHATSPSRKV